MKKLIFRYYIYLTVFLGTTFFIINLTLVLSLKNFFSSTVEKIVLLTVTYEKIMEFENSYFKTQNEQEFVYIKGRYKDFFRIIEETSNTIKDRELLFLLNEINEAVLKHQEIFFRSIVYLQDMTKGGDEDLYFIESFNLKKSKELFQGQKTSFNKKTKRFNEKLLENYKNDKNKREKIIITVFLLIVFTATISLKYIFIWGENNGYISSIKKSKGQKIKNFFN